jgi:hypothetical protein
MRQRAKVYDVASTLIESAGVLVTAYGLSQVYRPLGWILGGVFVALVGFSLSPKDPKDSERGPEYR